MASKSTFLERKGVFTLLLTMLSFTFSFAQTDITRPVVSSTTPGDWDISINAGTNVTAVFSETMNASTINGATFELRNVLNNALVTATVTYNAATKTATLYPTTPLNSLLYLATIQGGTTGVKDLSGNAMASDYSWYFIMIPLVDLTSPIVLSVTPANGATGVALGSSVTALLSEEMTPSTVNSSTVELRNASNVLVPATVSYNAATRLITLDPTANLTVNTRYTATIKSGSSGVKDEAGNSIASNYTWSFTTATTGDLVPPTIVSVLPANGATAVSNSATVSAVFSEAMNSATISTSTVELRNAANTLVTATVAYNATTKTMTLSPSALLAYSTVYTATVKGGAAGVKDAAGNALASNYVWSFTTMAAPDVTAPTITSVSPVAGTTGVSNSVVVSAIFSEAMNAATVSTTTVELRNAANTLVTATIAYNATTRTMTLTHSAALAYSTVYTATVKGGAAGVKDAAGNALASNYVWSFTTMAAPDVTAPTVTSVSPIAGTTGVSNSVVVSAIFSEAMNAATVSTTTVELRNAANVLVTATVAYNTTTKTMTLTPSAALAYATVYTATVKGGAAGVKDAAGNALAVNYVWSFTTMAAPDVTAPTVTSVSPLAGTTGVSTSVAVSAIFSEAMNAATVSTTTVELRTAASVLVTATVAYNATTKTMTLTPSAALANSTVYTATIKGGSAGVKDAAGNALAVNYVWSFTTATAPDVTAPTVTSVSPVAGTTGVSTSVVVSAIFSEAMNAATVSTTTVELRTAASVLVTATVAYNATTRTMTLTPSAALAYATVYTATVKGGAAGVKDAAGNPLASNYVWSFTTMTAPDVTAPTVTSVSPLAGTTGVSTGVVVSAIFSEAMNAATVSTTTVELRTAASVLVTATVAYNATTRTMTLTPSAALANSTVYTATVKGGAAGVKDAAGNALVNNYVWSFTTAVAVDATPPTVTLVSPVNGATGVSATATMSVTFSEAMNAATISTTTIELRNAANVLVTTAVTFNAATRMATITPSAALTSSSVYTVTVKGGSTGVKDAAGNPLAVNYTWSFTTGGSIFDPNILPDVPATIDEPVEVGVRFRSNTTGYITGLRFYKGAGNVGTHIGHLWTNTGVMMGEITFTQETASGWQQVLFATPIAITAGMTYVASYYSSAGIYAYTNNYFTQSYTNGALTALANGEDGLNGVYKYSSSAAFPTESFDATNYFVDVLFGEYNGPDVTAPFILSYSPVNNATGVSVSVAPTAVFNESLNAATVNSSTVEIRNASNNVVAATATYNSTTKSVVLTPSSALAYSSAYTVKIKGGSSGIKDPAGNALAADLSWTFTTAEPPFLAPTEGPGGPILVISTSANPFSRYAVEILRAEGLNEFAASDISAVTATVLNNYDVVVLGEMTVTVDQVLMLTNWVNAGGTLIAFKPSALLTPLLGIAPATGSISDKYLLVNTASGPGVGIVNQTIQFHGAANLHLLTTATSVATLYSSSTTATINPAVTSMNVGLNGGRAFAFTYDLAKSIIYTRQGNPAWAGQKRDGQVDPIRSDDMFFPDWIDFSKIAIPQADEQQRLLANMILQGNLHRKPLPRFWYLPRDLKAAIVMTGDDHSSNATEGRFNQYKALGPNTAQDIADWKAVRGTSYMYPGTPITNATATAFEAQGFEIALHPTTNCLNYTPASLQSDFTTQLAQFSAIYPGLSAPVTNRTHCLVWSDWASQPKVEASKGMRLDATYYYWPEEWMQNRPGMFTGSGMPMRFADLDGSLIDVYQAATQMTDETNMDYTTFCNAVLDKAVGAEGYYGVFTANMHNDVNPSPGSDAIIASAQARQIPVISSKQMLTWLDGRNNSSFGSLSWNGNQLTFTIAMRNSANSLKAMLPFNSANGQLVSITRNGGSIPFTTQLIKGMQYAFFAPAAGTSTYVATYGASTRQSNPPVEPAQPEQVVTPANVKEQPAKTATAPLAGKLYVNALPNPSNDYFNLVISSNDANPVTVRVVDLFGHLIETHARVTSTSILKLGQSWRGGTYIVEVLQGEQRKVIKMIKAN